MALKPPLKWAGGKRWLVPKLAPYWIIYAGQRLVEPFCGGLSVALGLNPHTALLNDINPHVINFYRQIQKGLVIESPMKNDHDFYMEQRKEFNWLTHNLESSDKRKAELFYYMNRTGFNGLCRFNKKGGFNVPFGKYKTINYVRDFTAYKEQLSKWEFSCKDFDKINLRSDDFIYADPPYDVEFRQYSQGGFEWDDQIRLATWLSKHPGPVVASNQATDRIVSLYERLGFRIEKLMGPRRISCTGDRSPAQEMLATKNVEFAEVS